MKMRIKLDRRWMHRGYGVRNGYADTTWINTSGGAWEDPANWNNGVPYGTTATTNGLTYLTNVTASYTVNYSVPPGAFNRLTMQNSGSFTTTLNINTNGFAALCNGATLVGQINLYGHATVNVNSNGVFDLGACIYLYGGKITLNVNKGGTLTWGNSHYDQPCDLYDNDYTSPGAALNIRGTMSATTNAPYAGNQWIDMWRSTVTIDGGSLLCDSFQLNSEWAILNITNNGTLTIRSGELDVGGGWYSTSGYTAVMNMSSGVVTNNGLLRVACDYGPSTYTGTGLGTINFSGGTFVQRGVATIGYARIGVFNLSGTGLFATTNMVLVGGTDSVTLDPGEYRYGILNVTGGQFIATNSAGGATMYVGSALVTGVVALAGGTLTIDNLVATNDVRSFFTFNAGTLAVRVSSAISNGTAFVAGNGTGSATLSLLGGTHSFSNGLVINTNAVFALGGTNAIGSATIFGDVTVRTNAVLNFDFNQITNDWVQVNGTVTLPAQAVLQVNALDSSIRTPIPVLQATQINGDASGWDPPAVNGRHYKARVVGNQLVLQCVPIGTVFVVR